MQAGARNRIAGISRAFATGAVACALGMTACATTQKVAVQQAGLSCGLLGSDCSRLTPGSEDQLALRWVNPNATWSQYNAVLIQPVTFWGAEASSVSPSDQQMLCGFLYQALVTQIGSTKLKVVQESGPGVMQLQAAIMDASTSTPGLRTISMVVPQARALNTLKYLATGTYAFVGGAQAEGRVMDSVTGQVLAEAVDRRVGGGSATAAASFQWGDAENVLTKEAEITAQRLAEWTSPGGAPR